MMKTFVGQSEMLREHGVSICTKAFFALMARIICLIYQELQNYWKRTQNSQ